MAFRPLAECGLIFVDFETSGLDAERNCPLSLAAIATDPSGKQVWHQYDVKLKPRPGAEMDPGALAVNGYTEEAWSDAVDPAAARMRILAIARDRVFVAHNVGFDWSFMLPLIGGQRSWPGPYHKVDTAALAWPLLRMGLIPDVKLQSCVDYFGHVNKAAHTAGSDAEACRVVYVQLMELQMAALRTGQMGLFTEAVR